MTENLKGKMGHKMNHFNVGKEHPIEEVKVILHCITFNIPCHNALNACTFVKKYTFFHLHEEPQAVKFLSGNLIS